MTQPAKTIMDLRDIVLPEAVSFWPPAPFVGFLLVLVVGGLLFLMLRWWLRWQAEAYRREGLSLTGKIETQLTSAAITAEGLAALGALLKRVALAAFPREAVAPLSGQAWLRFLETTCPGCRFTTGPGRLLADAAYDPAKAAGIQPEDGRQIVALAQTWIRTPPGPADSGSPAVPTVADNAAGVAGTLVQSAGALCRPPAGPRCRCGPRNPQPDPLSYHHLDSFGDGPGAPASYRTGHP